MEQTARDRPICDRDLWFLYRHRCLLSERRPKARSVKSELRDPGRAVGNTSPRPSLGRGRWSGKGPKSVHSIGALSKAYLYLAVTFETANDLIRMGLDAQLGKAWATVPNTLPGAGNMMADIR